MDTFHPNAPAGVPFDQLFQKVGGRIGGLLRICYQEAQSGKLVDSGILEQVQLRVCNTLARNYLHIHLDTFTRIGHLLVGFGVVRLFLLCRGKQPQFSHDSKQAFRTARIATPPQAMPQLHHTQRRIPTAHIPDQLQLCFCVLVGVAVGSSGLTGQGLQRTIPTFSPEVDIRPAFVILSAGSADAIFFCVFHKGLAICHVLCYTFTHEGTGLLSSSCCS